MKRTEAQKELNDAYNRLRVDYGLSENLLGEFLMDRGQPGLMTAFSNFHNTVDITADEVCGKSTNQALMEFVRLKLLVALTSVRDLLDGDIKKLQEQGGNISLEDLEKELGLDEKSNYTDLPETFGGVS